MVVNTTMAAAKIFLVPPPHSFTAVYPSVVLFGTGHQHHVALAREGHRVLGGFHRVGELERLAVMAWPLWYIASVATRVPMGLTSKFSPSTSGGVCSLCSLLCRRDERNQSQQRPSRLECLPNTVTPLI
jgi:hypothetical protein